MALDDVGSTARIELEIVLLRIAGGRLHYRCDRGRLRDGEHPDDAALRLAGDRAASVSHSTSWRFERPGLVVLTYVVLPDPHPDVPAVPLLEPAIVCSADPARPSPTDPQAPNVAAHAVRHLSELTWTDPGVRRAAADPVQRVLWSTIHRTAAMVAIHTHAQVQQLAAAPAVRPLTR